MKALYGVTTHGMEFVAKAVSRYKRSLPEAKQKRLKTQLLGFDEKINPRALVVLVPTLQWFLQNLREFNKSRAVVFVFDNPVQCDMLDPINLLDVREMRHSYQYELQQLTFDDIREAIQKGLNNRHQVEVTRETVDMIPRMLYTTRVSFLSPLQTFLYRIPDTTVRAKARIWIFRWMASKRTPEELEQKLARVIGYDKTPVSVTRILEFFETDTGQKGRAALAEYVKGKKVGKAPGYALLSKTHGLDAFDIKFVVRAMRKADYWQFPEKDAMELFKTRKLPQAQAKLYGFILSYQDEHGMLPTVTELSAHSGMAKSGLPTAVRKLEGRGYVRLPSAKSRIQLIERTTEAETEVDV